MKKRLSIPHNDLFGENSSAVYVGTWEFRFRDMIMSHMASADLEALHKMADIIGVSRKHFQDDPHVPHYDICKSKKKLAIKSGAIEIDDRDMILKCYPNFSLHKYEM